MSKKNKENIVEIAMEEPMAEITEEAEEITEEPKKAVKTIEQKKQEFIEIKTETLFIKIPKDEKVIQETINILNTFIAKQPQETEEPRQQPTEVIYEEPIRPQQSIGIRRQPIEREEEQTPLKSNEIVAVNPQERFTSCPICNGKLVRDRVQQLDDAITQIVRCKDKRCSFERRYIVNL